MVNARLHAGTPIFLWEGTQLGTVKEVRGAYVQVDAPFVPDYWVAANQLRERNGRLELGGAFAHFDAPPEPDTAGEHPDAAPTSFQRILVPLDGSALSERAIGYAADMAPRYDALVILLRAFDGPRRLGAQLVRQTLGTRDLAHNPYLDEQTRAAGRAAAADVGAYLAAHRVRLEEVGVAVELRAPDADPAEAILEEAHRTPGTAVVMATRGRSGLGRLVLGSVAYDVVRRSRAPVLLVRVADGPATWSATPDGQRTGAEPLARDASGASQPVPGDVNNAGADPSPPLAKDDGLNPYDRIVAASFPASDPQPGPASIGAAE